MNYSYNFGSNFPRELIPVGTKKDIDDSVKDLIIQYYSLIDSGNISEANALYLNHKDTLESYVINMNYISRLEEEIYNIGFSVLNQITNIISDTEPSTQSVGGFWYQEY